MKKYLKSGYNTIQDLKLEPGTYTLVLYVKSMYSNVYTFALGYDTVGPPENVIWTEYDIDVLQGELCKVWFTFTIKKSMTKLKPIAKNYSYELPVYVAELQLTRGNVPVEAGASPFDFDQILDDLHDSIDGIEDFTNDAFRDGLLDREEKTQLRSSLDAISSIVESVKGSYAKLRLNPFINEGTMTSITRRYEALMLAWINPNFNPYNPFDEDDRGRRKNKGGFKDIILWIVNGDNIIQDYERNEKDRALNAFNTNLFKYNQSEKQVYSDVGDNSVAPKIIDGFWAFWNPKKWDSETQRYGAFEKSNFSAIGDNGHSPYIDVLTNTWWEWNPDLWNPITRKYGDYWDTGLKAEGEDVKSIEIEATPTSIVISGDEPNTSWIFVSATAQNTEVDFDSWKFFVDDSLVVDVSSIAFYNEQEKFWTIEANEVILLHPNAKAIGVSVKSTDTPPLTKTLEIPFIGDGARGRNTATVHLYKRIPEGNIRLWKSTRIFTSDGLDPQQDEWTNPEVIADSDGIDIEFSSKLIDPGTPTGHPNTNPDWSNTADETTIWMATSNLEGEEWTPWVVSKIKGESEVFTTVFTRSDTEPKKPEGGDYEARKPTTEWWSFNIPEGDNIIYPIQDYLVYDFIKKGITEGDMNGWSINMPSGYDQLYVTGATASNRLDIDEISPNEWAEPVKISSDGFNSASITLYQRSVNKPLEINEDCVYTFSTGKLEPIPDGWSRTIPTYGDDKKDGEIEDGEIEDGEIEGDDIALKEKTTLYVTTATAISVKPTDIIKKEEWADFGSIGEDGQSSLKSTAFIRTNEVPKPPIGGTYLDPNPGINPEAVDEVWSDGIPSGNKRLWASTRIFTSNGLLPQQDDWTTPEVMVDSAGFDVEFSSEEEPGIPGGPPNEGDVKNPNWSNTADETTIWMATSNFKNGMWGEWSIAKIKGEGGQGSLKSTAFIRTNEEPKTPIGGTYLDPNPGINPEAVDEVWSDGVPSGDKRLWASTRIFTSNGLLPQQDDWTTPEVMADSAGFDVEFSSIEINPGDPTKNPENWSNTADETTIWMATSNLENGIWSKWSIAKIKGEKGKDGNSAPLLVIAESAQVMICNYNNVAEAGQTIEIEAKLQNVTDTAKFVATPYNDAGTALTAITLGGSGNTRTLTNAQWLTTYKKVVITVTLGSLSDVTTIHRLSRPKDGDNGKDALVGFLTNENITLQASSTGNISSFATANGYFRLYSGITLVTSGRTFDRVSQTGCTVAINSTTGYYSVSGMSADNATATFSVKYGTTTIEKTLTLSKSKAGVDGTPGSNGLPGQIPIQKEWKVGDTHRNTDEIIDYIYVRGANKNVSYWYKLKSTGTRRAPEAPDANYVEIDWLKELAVNVLLAEEANVAGFIFKENKLISEKGTLYGAPAGFGDDLTPSQRKAFIPNLVLNGKEGDVKITGTVNATSGSIGGLTIEGGKLYVGSVGGNRIELDPYNRRIRLINDANQLMGEIYFEAGDTYGDIGAGVEMNHFYQGVKRNSIRLGGVMADVTMIGYNTSGAITGRTSYRHDGIYIDGVKQGTGGGSGYTHPSTHSASMITAGTFDGIVKANSNISYTTKQVRNMILSTNNAISSQMANGDIWIKYE